MKTPVSLAPWIVLALLMVAVLNIIHNPTNIANVIFACAVLALALAWYFGKLPGKPPP